MVAANKEATEPVVPLTLFYMKYCPLNGQNFIAADNIS
jgi:hypothetical protein